MRAMRAPHTVMQIFSLIGFSAWMGSLGFSHHQAASARFPNGVAPSFSQVGVLPSLRVWSVALLVALLLNAPVFGQMNAAPATAPAPSSPTSNNTASSGGANAVTQAAVQQGAFACASRINQVSNFLGFNAQAGALVMLPPSQADQRLITLAMEVPTEDAANASSAYVSATFAPNQANGCGAAYDAVIYWPLKCDAVAAKQFPNLKRAGQLKWSLAVLDGGPATKIFLMPAGSGCVSIKKEVVL